MQKMFTVIQKILSHKYTKQVFAVLFDKNVPDYRKIRYAVAICLSFFYFIPLIAQHGLHVNNPALYSIISPLTSRSLTHLIKEKGTKEVFGFAPYWNINKLDNIDFGTLTTFAYFGIPVNADGSFQADDPGYQTFQSQKATDLFQRAHSYGTRVVLTLTQMNNTDIEGLMGDPQAQKTVIQEAVRTVATRGIDGVNIDFEYMGDPGSEYRDRFSSFVKNMTDAMHTRIPNSKVTVSVYASAVKDPKIYDIHTIANTSDGIFMMAYDFATTSADNAMPTAPLYGYKQGKYWYDISTAVDDFLTEMPANKLILGVPWYGYNYVVYKPGLKAETRPYYAWQGQPMAQTYVVAKTEITPSAHGVGAYQTGWDVNGQVGWKAYYDSENGTWRMIFIDDVKSLGIKYDFAKNKNLAGVGMWALGNDAGTSDMWQLLREKFGIKLADSRLGN